LQELISNGKKLTYEIHGDTGEYLLLLNGLMMTDKSWLTYVPTLMQYYKVICFNMHDQGNSEMMDELYPLDRQVEAVLALIDHIGIEKINLIGTSYGGCVALSFSIKYPARVKKMLVFNTPVYADPYIIEIGRLWQKAALSYNVDTYYDSFAPNLYAPEYFEKHYDTIYQRKELLRPFLTAPYYDSIVRLCKSNEKFDVRDDLDKITAPVLIIGGDEDYITPLRHQRIMAEKIPDNRFIILPGGGHGVVFEKSDMIVFLAIGWFREINVMPVF
jgi:pimeloyl-ACP methyl ester carboxylesterase